MCSVITAHALKQGWLCRQIDLETHETSEELFTVNELIVGFPSADVCKQEALCTRSSSCTH